MRPVLRELQDAHLYSFQRPGTNNPVPTIGDYKSVSEVLGSPEKWRSPQYARASEIMKGSGSVSALCDVLYVRSKRVCQILPRIR